MKMLHSSSRLLIYGGAVFLLCTACDLLNPIFHPQKEFIIPLAVGNKWVYDYTYSARLASGTEIWEVTKQELISEGTKYTLRITGEGTETFPQNKPYTYQFEMMVLSTRQSYIFQYSIALSDKPDTISRFASDIKDTVTFTNNGGTDISSRSYVNKIGHVYFYNYSGSPGSGRSSIKRTLHTYTLK